MTNTKTGKIIYWIATLWLALGLVSTAYVQLSGMKAENDFMTELGFPVYILKLLGIWKILGTIAILVPRFPLVKEWAYAGMFFLTTGALYSHFMVHDGFDKIYPSLLLLALTLISWYFRPANRKLITNI
ncbi:DoxX family protein [Chitinophaga sp. Cy-1792]|uniref:DoxX family protein n=1 Tax=Chitinophaga sp. Cy-1792 TaxID=2608339 RepID=UPI001422539F|nr:DoxX family protein [Chitinophaga sp. Cy-1792]NIG55685.1 DoxX family protein [Chitinophaga sp. Cy-1792]